MRARAPGERRREGVQRGSLKARGSRDGGPAARHRRDAFARPASFTFRASARIFEVVRVRPAEHLLELNARLAGQMIGGEVVEHLPALGDVALPPT